MARQPSPARMEAFSDGVIAVIITIMVLEFKVPHEAGAVALLALLPTLLVYALSFAVVGVYWVNHHYMVDRLKRVDGLVLWANLSFLFTLSLLPFFTEYLIVHHQDPLSVAIYSVSMFCDGVTFQWVGRAITRNLRPEGGEPETAKELEELRAESWKAKVSLALDLVACGLARWHPHLALATIALVPPLWIVPESTLKPPHRRQRAGSGSVDGITIHEAESARVPGAFSEKR